MQQSVHCVAEIEHILRRAGVTPSALDGIAVALGPGGFTSLRVGLSVAKGLSLALNRPLVGVDTLLATVYPYRGLSPARTLGAIVDVGRGELAAQWYSEPGLAPEGAVALGDVAAIAAAAPPGELLVVAEIEADGQAQLAMALGARAVLVAMPAPLARIAGLAALGWERLQAGHVDDRVALQPHYPRRSGQPAHGVP
jgi:tRNA threonylcarbamoyladenosine biosynthesis protein TsaB